MRKIKIVHYGLAHDHSAVTLECARKYPEVFDVVGIVEPDQQIREKFGKHQAYQGLPFFTEEELFSRHDIDAVLCEAQELRSVSDAQKCLDHGLHVHLDKPGGIDFPAFAKLMGDARKKGLTVQMGYMFRYNPAMEYALERVKSGVLGRITGIDGSFSCLHNSEKRQWLRQFPGGMMFYLGCHTIDMMLLINGMPDAVIPFNRSSGCDCDGALDSCFAVLDYPHGVCGVRVNAVEVNGYSRRQLVICGSGGTLEIEPLEQPTLLRESLLPRTEGVGWADISQHVFPGYLPGRYDKMMLEFAAYVRGEKENPFTPEYELDVQKVVLQACGIQV